MCCSHVILNHVKLISSIPLITSLISLPYLPEHKTWLESYPNWCVHVDLFTLLAMTPLCMSKGTLNYLYCIASYHLIPTYLSTLSVTDNYTSTTVLHSLQGRLTVEKELIHREQNEEIIYLCPWFRLPCLGHYYL